MAGEVKGIIDEVKGRYISKKGIAYGFYSRKYGRLFRNYQDFLSYLKRDIRYRMNRNFIKKRMNYQHPRKGKKRYIKKGFYQAYFKHGN